MRLLILTLVVAAAAPPGPQFELVQPELFAAAGIRFDFSEKTLRPLMNELGDELARLPA